MKSVQNILWALIALGVATVAWLFVFGLPDWATHSVGRALQIDNLESIKSAKLTFAAPWADGRPALVLFACAAAAAAGAVFYMRYQQVADQSGRVALSIVRAVLLASLIAILAEPVIALAIAHRPRPLLVMLFDGTDSMNIQDRLDGDQIKSYAKAVKLENGQPAADLEEITRLGLVQQVVAGDRGKAFDQLAKKYRLRAYVMDRLDQMREVEWTDAGLGEEETFDGEHLAEQLASEGQVTAIGNALDGISRRHPSHLLAGAVLFSDFDQNAGAPALAAAKRLKTPVYTVGVGPREVVDLSVELQAPLVLKKDERTSVSVHLRQTGLTGRAARVSLLARRLGSSEGGMAETEASPVAPAKTIEIDDERVSFDMPFLPTVDGRFVLQVKVDPFAGEVLEDNNTASREVTIRDDSLKLLFVEYEPTWEWRFIKEVFHRDPLIGREGFRTFLRSADFKVRRTNELFLETLVRPRSEFFSHDVIFLSDVPAEMLSNHFQAMLEEYVEKFGGGLVVIAGPRFGAGALQSSKIADMLPVVVDATIRPRVGQFVPRLTPEAAKNEFMQLGGDDRENRLAWSNLGRLPWYQPVVRPHPLGTVLAEHPVDRCIDNQTPQPLIAVRRYGKGEVVYLGFNETWRLRRKYGEKYYRQFWGQMIYRLGLGRALGSQKRFVVYTDRPSYQAGDKVRVTVEAYNDNFDPLDVDQLSARMIAQTSDLGPGGDAAITQISVPVARDKVVFETQVPVYGSGAHRILVKDPVTRDEVEVNFKVAPVTAERRNAVRDFALQEALAAETGGESYELHDVANIANDLQFELVERETERRFEVWNTWLVLGLVLMLLLGEWLFRKLMNLR